eukprot:TRINITY_DN38411_c0_g1_i1.p1 TRINITY_DN38411_c0_g1~~TRINITY_DN38411_c0_g1_i1.p1  ORF type:complete len:814 (+),score=137.09 TRINITY_DN38411_c0_g1_i1:65-2506(+)
MRFAASVASGRPPTVHDKPMKLTVSSASSSSSYYRKRLVLAGLRRKQSNLPNSHDMLPSVDSVRVAFGSSGNLISRRRRKAGVAPPVAVAFLVFLARKAESQTTPAPSPNASNVSDYAGMERFNCNTTSCSRHDNWFPIDPIGQFSDKGTVCQDAQDDAIKEFGLLALRECENTRMAMLPWKNCRKLYCEMYEKIIDKISWEGGPGFFGGDECRPLVNFNKTLCETTYRDAEAFCECFCPSILYFDVPSACKIEMVSFFILGRRGLQLARRHVISKFCSIKICGFWADLADPRKPLDIYNYGGVPPKCRELSLPFRPGQCQRLFMSNPYEPCPWREDSGDRLALRCMDGHECQIDVRNVDSWSCCLRHNYRKQCPGDWPVMCEDPLECNGKNDHCCEKTASQCSTGVRRQCSAAMTVDLPEWTGYVALGVERPGQNVTTTMDPSLAKMLAFTTTKPPTFIDMIRPSMPYVLGIVGGVFGCCSLAMCYFVCGEHVVRVSKATYGLAKALTVLRADPVLKFAPSGKHVPNKDRDAPVADKPDPKVLQKLREDEAARDALLDAVNKAYNRGSRGLILGVNSPPSIPQEFPLKAAMRVVRERNLHNEVENVDLLKRGAQWLTVLEAERTIVEEMEIARPDLRMAASAPVPPPNRGMPWYSTQDFRNIQGCEKSERWGNIERLTEAIRTAKADGASDALVNRAEAVREELVARTRELPANRCVLDPEGEGVKLLPRGKQRAIWPVNGSNYIYEVNAEVGGDDLPPREELANTGVDSCRPVCSIYNEGKKCHLGRRCPWRHAKPMPGDSIREPLNVEDL